MAEADPCSQPGDIGQLLRREGLYSFHLSKWRAERDQAMRASLTKQRGRPRAEKNPLAEENARLQSEIERLKTRLAQAEGIIEVQEKLSHLLGWDQAQPGLVMGHYQAQGADEVDVFLSLRDY